MFSQFGADHSAQVVELRKLEQETVLDREVESVCTTYLRILCGSGVGIQVWEWASSVEADPEPWDGLHPYHMLSQREYSIVIQNRRLFTPQHLIQ